MVVDSVVVNENAVFVHSDSVVVFGCVVVVESVVV